MGYFSGKDWSEARKQAQANADFFNCNFVVFTDTSGNIYVERQSIAPTCGGDVVKPNVKK
jgi:hypothetical protein